MRAVGVDVGGTKLAAALVDVGTADVVREARSATRAHQGGRAVLDACVALATEVAGGASYPVGVGLCEYVDLRGRPTSSVTIDWRDLDVHAAFAAVGPLHVESDVRAAALAEARFGAGVGVRAFVYLSVGTGVSFCHVLDGVPYPGARGNAIAVGAPPVELVAGGRALADAESDLPLEAAAAAVGVALAALVNALDPELVVVGGGLGLVDGYLTHLVSTARPLIDAPGTRELPVVPASLGERTGVVGAALVAPR